MFTGDVEDPRTRSSAYFFANYFSQRLKFHLRELPLLELQYFDNVISFQSKHCHHIDERSELDTREDPLNEVKSWQRLKTPGSTAE